jgi:hypothetical protein
MQMQTFFIKCTSFSEVFTKYRFFLPAVFVNDFSYRPVSENCPSIPPLLYIVF